MNRKTVIGALLTLVLVAGVAGFYEWRLAVMEGENRNLRHRLACLKPSAPQIILPPIIPVPPPYTVAEVRQQGASIKFRTLEIDYKWNRPIYIPLWHSRAWSSGRFCYLPRLIENNRHRVFVYQGGGSYWFDISPAMGFTDETAPLGMALKTREEVAIVALEASIKEIVKFRNQLQIVIEPARQGYHIVAITVKDYQNSFCQVVTPDGYELEVPQGTYSNTSYQ